LVQMLQKYDPSEDWYLGKPSIRAPLEIVDRETNEKLRFKFATGGAGFCLSRSLALKMEPIASGGKFISIGEKIRLPDDVTVGFIVEHLLGKKLTVIQEFHSHLESMKFLDNLQNQITFSYSRFGDEMNVLSLNSKEVDLTNDPTRFIALHCHLFPNFGTCEKSSTLSSTYQSAHQPMKDEDLVDSEMPYSKRRRRRQLDLRSFTRS